MTFLKQILFFLFAIILAPEMFSQQGAASGAFVHLSQVEQPPFSADCSYKSTACIAAVVENYVLNKITGIGNLSDENSEKIEVALRLIIDTTGRVSWASVKGLPQASAEELVILLKQMPAFLPGVHQDEKANVIGDFVIPLYISETRETSSGVVAFEDAKQKPVWKKCRRVTEKEICTQTALNEWMNRNVDLNAIKEPGNYTLKAKFVVDVDGKVSRIAVLGGGDAFAAEVIEQLQCLPQLEPGTENGEPVAVSFLLPMSLRRM